MAKKDRRIFGQSSGSKTNWLFRFLKWLAIIFACIVLADIYWLSTIWPDWDALAEGPIPESSLIRDYRQRANIDSHLPAVRWSP